MKKHTKLAIHRNTLRALDIVTVRGGFPDRSVLCDPPTDDRLCNSDHEGSHALTCGNGTQCRTTVVC